MGFRVPLSNSLVDGYQYISRHDDAIDDSIDDFDLRWTQYLDGHADAPLKASAQPTVWHFRQLSSRQRMRVLDTMGSNQLEGGLLALALGLVKADNLLDDRGRIVKIEHAYEDGMRVVSEQTLEAIRAAGGDELLFDLAGRVVRSLSPDPK